MNLIFEYITKSKNWKSVNRDRFNCEIIFPKFKKIKFLCYSNFLNTEMRFSFEKILIKNERTYCSAVITSEIQDGPKAER